MVGDNMKNPINRRLPFIFKDELGKYIVIFLFMTLSIALISGFIVADSSMIKAYNDSFEKYNIEDGHFELSDELDDDLKTTLEKENVKIYDLQYIEQSVDNNKSTLRIFKPRDKVNKVCLMSGELATKENEVAIDRMYAENNNYHVGDTVTIGDKKFHISGLIALSDYSALFSNNSDLMFDSIKFGVAVMSKEGYNSFENTKIHYNYAWLYNEKVNNEVNAANDFLSVLVKKSGNIEDFVPQYINQAIQFTGDGMGGDQMMMEVLLYIIIVIMAFVFAVTTLNTIENEAPMIGTLRAMGYTKKELLMHYMILPVLVTLLAAFVGNVLGYTILKDYMAGLYYGSYSLPTYVTIWSLEAFIKTTLIPIIIMIIINVAIIINKLKLSPLRFIRKDLKKTKKRKMFTIQKLSFFHQFRLSVIIQNISSYATLFVGIFFALTLLMFGMVMRPILNHYQDLVIDNLTADYQYVLNMPDDVDTSFVEEMFSNIPEVFRETFVNMIQDTYQDEIDNYFLTDNKDAEKFSMSVLKTLPENTIEESVSIYGIENNSQYIHIKKLPEKGVYISKDLSDKYNLKEGDTISLKESYEDVRYTFQIAGIYEAPGSMALYMSKQVFNDTFNHTDNYFNGYFSSSQIKDIKDEYISSIITVDDMTKVSRQLDVSMGDMFEVVKGFSIIMFAILIYLLTKMIIENNVVSISMIKILGFNNREISSLYISATTIVVIVSTLISFILTTILLSKIFIIVFSNYSGWLPFYVEPVIYIKMFIMTILAYLLVMLLQMRKIKQIPMDEALKSVE